MWFLFVRPRICLRLPSDSASRRTPLPSVNSSYCQVCRGLSPPSYRPCRAHHQEKAALRAASKMISIYLTVENPTVGIGAIAEEQDRYERSRGWSR
jgi:hypothetical protein